MNIGHLNGRAQVSSRNYGADRGGEKFNVFTVIFSLKCFQFRFKNYTLFSTRNTTVTAHGIGRRFFRLPILFHTSKKQ